MTGQRSKCCLSEEKWETIEKDSRNRTIPVKCCSFIGDLLKKCDLLKLVSHSTGREIYDILERNYSYRHEFLEMMEKNGTQSTHKKKKK